MAQTRPSPTLSRGFTRLGRFLAPYGLSLPGPGRRFQARVTGRPARSFTSAIQHDFGTKPCCRRTQSWISLTVLAVVSVAPSADRC